METKGERDKPKIKKWGKSNFDQKRNNQSV